MTNFPGTSVYLVVLWCAVENVNIVMTLLQGDHFVNIIYLLVCTCLCRSGQYQLNFSAGSDGDLLLTSPGRDKDFKENNETELSANVSHTSANPSSSHDPLTTPSSNGIVATSPPKDSSSPKGQRKVLNSNDNCSINTDSNAGTRNSESGNATTKVNSEGTTADGEVAGDEELQENYR